MRSMDMCGALKCMCMCGWDVWRSLAIVSESNAPTSVASILAEVDHVMDMISWSVTNTRQLSVPGTSGCCAALAVSFHQRACICCAAVDDDVAGQVRTDREVAIIVRLVAVGRAISPIVMVGFVAGLRCFCVYVHVRAHVVTRPMFHVARRLKRC